MQMRSFLFVASLASALIAATPVLAESTAKPAAKTAGKTYSEEEFLARFQNRSRKQITDALGKPVRVGQSSKPLGADAVVSTMGKPTDKSKVVNVEMWYYEDKVKYDDKHTYKTVELTFVNDRCLNITYFNNR